MIIIIMLSQYDEILPPCGASLEEGLFRLFIAALISMASDTDIVDPNGCIETEFSDCWPTISVLMRWASINEIAVLKRVRLLSFRIITPSLQVSSISSISSLSPLRFSFVSRFGSFPKDFEIIIENYGWTISNSSIPSKEQL